jgi:hypothetical protein
MTTLTRRETLSAAVAVAAAHTLHVLPVQADAPEPTGLRVGVVHEVASSIAALAGFVRDLRAEAGTLDPELDHLIARAVADIDTGARRLQEAMTLAQG